MVTYTMHMKVMIYLSSRMLELRVRSRDAIVAEALRSALVSGDHPKKPTRGVCEHASMCTRADGFCFQGGPPLADMAQTPPSSTAFADRGRSDPLPGSAPSADIGLRVRGVRPCQKLFIAESCATF